MSQCQNVSNFNASNFYYAVDITTNNKETFVKISPKNKPFYMLRIGNAKIEALSNIFLAKPKNRVLIALNILARCHKLARECDQNVLLSLCKGDETAANIPWRMINAIGDYNAFSLLQECIGYNNASNRFFNSNLNV